LTTIFITGGTGKVGSKLTDILLQKGQKVRLIARHREKLETFAKKGAEIAAGSLLDTAFLTKAYIGAKAVFTMLPADFAAPDIGAYQEKAGESILSAMKGSGVSHVVNLSSLGRHTTLGTGIVAGLAKLEAKLNGLGGVTVLHLRHSYFMENLLGQIGTIKSMGMFGSTIKPDVSMPLVATQDIARLAAEKLTKLDFKGHSVLPIMGPRNYTMVEAAKALGAAIGKPDLKYVQFPADQVKTALMQMGLSASVADAFNGLSEGINKGVMNVDKRTPESTTPTTIEEFAKLFALLYNQ
jgi:uncharacterized protein YbjT (DUF2867 family)